MLRKRLDITGGQAGQQVGGSTLEIVMVAFLSIGLFNSLELLVQIFFQFKQHRGLYFWSMLIATLGIPIYSVGFILKYWAPDAPWEIGITLIEVGWVSFVTGQAILLYSRLHLVLFSRRILRFILIMIIVDGVILHSITIVATFGSNSPSSAAFVVFYTFLEKLQMTIFSLQETIISGVYIWATTRFFTNQSKRNKLMRHLIYVNVFIILLDIVMLGFVYANSYELETTIKPAIYSIKLKLEFAVLNQLVGFSRASVAQASQGTNEMTYPARDARRQSSKFTEPSREQMYSFARHSHAGILRTTTVIVGSGDNKTTGDGLTSRSQECIISRVTPNERAQIFASSEKPCHTPSDVV